MSNPVEVELAIEWIKLFAKPRKTINKRYSSYGLKHIAERWANHYISNTSFIEAMNSCGFKKQRLSPNDINFYFNIRTLNINETRTSSRSSSQQLSGDAPQ